MANCSWYRGRYPPSLIEAIAAHDLLSNLGYSLATEVFLTLYPDVVAVSLRADGREVQLYVGTPELAVEEMVARWKELVREWNTGGTCSNEEKDWLWESSTARRHAVDIVEKLVLQGFRRGLPDLQKVKHMH